MAEKLWSGRTDGVISKIADDFNSSISFDKRMYIEDITGSMAHATMLGAQGIIAVADATAICEGLQSILDDINSGKLLIDPTAEDIHTFVEQTLTERIGDAGKKLHTARSRNDQVALDFKMFVKKEALSLCAKLKVLIKAITLKAEEYKSAIMSGYTHLQRAQPITFGHQLMAYSMMFLRDCDRLKDCVKHLNVSPIGSCALAGTTFDTDRELEARSLGFDGITLNSIDGVSDRDFAVEFLGCLSLIMMHLSRFSEEIILWSSWEFKYIELSNEFTTGSSIMPQKKNPDMAELVRGKTGRVYGDLIGTLTMLKGLPLAYNKDMQEDKESVFDAVDTVNKCLDVFTPMISSLKALTVNMRSAAEKGFINATDLADYLTKKGVPFREAYKTVGAIVSKCIAENKTLETLTIKEYKAISDKFDDDLYAEINLENCVEKRISKGGTSVKSVEEQIAFVKECVKDV